MIWVYRMRVLLGWAILLGAIAFTVLSFNVFTWVLNGLLLGAMFKQGIRDKRRREAATKRFFEDIKRAGEEQSD